MPPQTLSPSVAPLAPLRLLPPLNVVVDAGVDDAVALAVLVGAGVELSQVIATEGSVAVDVTASATARLLATLGARSVPVLLGASTGIEAPYPGGRDPFHGADAFGGFAAQLADVATPASGPDRVAGQVFAAGALTVVAEALRRGDPVSSVIWMGGAFCHGGNMTAAAEFNAWMDPASVDEVFTAGVPVSMVPLDLTMQCEWTAGEIDELARLGDAGMLLSKPAGMMCGRDGAFVPHDAVTAVALLQPGLFRWAPKHVRCEPEGRFSAGTTIADRRPHAPQPNVLVAEECDTAGVRTAIFDAIGRLG